MIALDVYRQLKAFNAGKPIPNGESKRFHLVSDKDLMIVAFVRMGGESRPWGIAYGTPNKPPKLLSVPEARNRDLVAEMVVEFATALLKHLRHPSFSSTAVEQKSDLEPLRQVWLPNDSHLDMLHHLAFAYARTRFGGETQPTLNAFGRACGWLFRESQRPGQMATMVTTNVLTEAFTFPCERIRQSHLGYLLAWLRSKGNYRKRIATAGEAENVPMSTSLAPDDERIHLAPLVEKWGPAFRSGSVGECKKLSKDIAATISPALEHRWNLVSDAIGLLREDKRHTNAGVTNLVSETVAEQWYQFIRMELQQDDDQDGPAFFTSIETDHHPAAAASRFMVYQASAELVNGLLIHDDEELFAEAVSRGDAFRGKIIEVRDEGTNRSTRPVWTILDKANRQLRLREGSGVEAVGFKKRQAEIVSVSDHQDGVLIELEITASKTNRSPGPGIHAFPPNERVMIGKEVKFASRSGEGISRMKAQKVWKNDGPGAWLTHRSKTRLSQIPESAIDGSINSEDAE
jgi:hypothetical protein